MKTLKKAAFLIVAVLMALICFAGCTEESNETLEVKALSEEMTGVLDVSMTEAKVATFHKLLKASKFTDQIDNCSMVYSLKFSDGDSYKFSFSKGTVHCIKNSKGQQLNCTEELQEYFDWILQP